MPFLQVGITGGGRRGYKQGEMLCTERRPSGRTGVVIKDIHVFSRLVK